MASQHISLPDLPPDQLVAWCNETSWLNTHGKLVRSHVSEDTHKELKPIFSIIKEENAERIAFDDLVEMFTVLGDPLTAEDVRQMLKGVHARATLGVTYAQFVQLVMRDHELHRQDPEEAAGPAMVYADHTRAMMLAYCRKKVVEGVMADKNNWRARLQKRAQKQAQPKLKGRTSIFAQASRGSQAVIPLAATRAAGLRFTATPEDVIAAQLAAPREADNTTVGFADDDGRHATQQQTMTGLRISFEGAAGAYHQEDSPRLTSDSADSDRSDCSHATDDTDCSIQHSQPEDEPYDAHEERQFSSFHGQAAEAVLASRGDLWELPEEAADADMREATPASHNWPGTSSSDSLWARSQKRGASSAASSQHVSRGRSSDSGLDLEARAHQTVRWEDESITLEDKRRAKAHARLLSSLGPISDTLQDILDDFTCSRSLSQPSHSLHASMPGVLQKAPRTPLINVAIKDQQRAQQHKMTSQPVAVRQQYRCKAVQAMLAAC